MSILWEKIPPYVINLFERFHQPSMVYHNLAHTQEVVYRSKEIAHHYQLTDTEDLTLFIAAWFHDTGHLTGVIEGHERVSAEIMKQFLMSLGEAEALIPEITACILATVIPSNPDGLLEKILCDADTYHLGTPAFFHSDIQIKRELELREGKIFQDWDLHTLRFMEEHRYHTRYCQDLLNPGKEANMTLLRKKMGQEGK